MRYEEVSEYKTLPAMRELTECVSLANKSASMLANRVKEIDTSPKQYEIIGLAASGYSIFYGILPLLQVGLLVPAAVIIRSLLERVANIAWMAKAEGDTYDLFRNHWDDFKKRPSITKRISFLDNFIGDSLQTEEFNFVISDHLKDDWLNLLHSYTHGDHKLILTTVKQDGEYSNFAAGPDPQHPEACSAFAKLAVFLFCQLDREVDLAIPQLWKQS